MKLQVDRINAKFIDSCIDIIVSMKDCDPLDLARELYQRITIFGYETILMQGAFYFLVL